MGKKDMEMKRLKQLMEIERECVIRGAECDRDCGKCDLVQDTDELLKAYEMLQIILDKFVEEEIKLNSPMTSQDSHMLRMIIDLVAIGKDRFLQINDDFSEEYFNELQQIIINKVVFGEFANLITMVNGEDEDDSLL